MVKYEISFYDDSNQVWRVDIDLPGYSGDPIPVTGVGRVFCSPEWSADDDDPYAPIVNSKVQIQFYNKSGEVDVLELQSLSEMTARLIVYRGVSLWWSGYIAPEGIQRLLKPNPYPITINATDGLEMLKDVPFSFTGDWRLPVTASSYAPLGIIRYVLYSSDNLNIRLPLRWQCDIESIEYNDSAIYGTLQWGALGDAWNFFDSENVKSCYEILENMVRGFQCRLFQFGGKWHLQRINDIVDGDYDWTEIAAETGNNPAVTTGSSNMLADMQTYYRFVDENQLMTYRSALTDTVVTYNHYQAENILPNGNMDRWTSLGVLLYWGFETNPDAQFSYNQYESLDGRDGHAALIKHSGINSDEGIFTYFDGLPVDFNILYKRFTMGFQWMPVDLGTGGFDGNELVDWDKKPLKVSVKYVLPDATYYLNEFGYWQSGSRGTDLGVIFVNRTTTYSGPPLSVFTHRMYFSGSPNIGDVLRIEISSHVTIPFVSYDFTVTPLEENNLSLALDGLLSALSGSPTASRSVNMTSSDAGYIEFTQSANVFSPPLPKGSTYKSGAIQEYEFIYPTVDQLKRLDIASVQFVGKGGNSEILVPDPGDLSENTSNTLGKLYVMFYLKQGHEHVYDNIYVRIDDNNDVYKSSIPGTGNKTNKHEVELGISTSFSGFMLSNVMTQYNKSGTEFRLTDGVYTGSLTGMTANAIMRFRAQPSEVFSGSLHTQGNDWQYNHIYTLDGKKFLPLGCRYNIETCTVEVNAIECRDGSPTLDEKHYGSNDKILSDT